MDLGKTRLTMAKAYSDDRRRELLQAYDRGEGTLKQLAGAFQVSVPWAWKISAQRKRSGQMERVEQRRGGGRIVNAGVEPMLRRWLQAQPDLTLAELQQTVAERLDLHVSIGWLSPVVGAMRRRLKKSHSKAANAKPKRISSSNKPSRKPSAGSRRST